VVQRAVDEIIDTDETSRVPIRNIKAVAKTNMGEVKGF
jgi:hypothetical protein